MRSIIGECLHYINLINGKVISVTTDGFITYLSDLESKLKKNFLFNQLKKIRKELSGKDTGLELKHSNVGYELNNTGSVIKRI